LAEFKYIQQGKRFQRESSGEGSTDHVNLSRLRPQTLRTELKTKVIFSKLSFHRGLAEICIPCFMKSYLSSSSGCATESMSSGGFAMLPVPKWDPFKYRYSRPLITFFSISTLLPEISQMSNSIVAHYPPNPATNIRYHGHSMPLPTSQPPG
jgi:hypothetical protein